MATLSPETEYLRDLACAWASGAETVVQVAGDLDGDGLLRTLSVQPAMQTLTRHLDTSALPAAERAQLDSAMAMSRRRTSMMLMELERVLPVLAAAGCRPVVLKGAALALTVYDAPEDRWFVDLDLLVHPDELSSCYAALERLGYRFQERPGAARYYENHHFHRILLNNQGICIEVHWALTLPRSVYSHDLGALRAAASEVPHGKASLLAPSAGDQILHGVLQSIAGGYGDLRRILDLHRLDATMEPEQRGDLCARARAANLATGLWLQYHLRRCILGCEMPSVIARRCGPSVGIRRLIDRLDLVAGCLERHRDRDAAQVLLLHLLCVPARLVPREVWRYLAPSEAMRLEAEVTSGQPTSPARTARLVGQRLLILGQLVGRLVRAALRIR